MATASLCGGPICVVKHLISPAGPFYCYISTKIGTWISNGIHRLTWDVITHQCSKFNDGLAKPPVKLEHG